ncbi:hypothetical protein C2G38_2167409 [Gigaspora rosea]|uniref:Uncharacterized protein n=1 Tax=Gigaspora rosea TaxID=44941 RepID=A0A397W0R8_9GLOM|nr:hypothetical protein C2G38_2167409 [Gigaspora rosea]
MLRKPNERMKREPKNCPSATKICEILEKWQSDKNILSELTKFDELLKNIKSTQIQTHPEDIYKSKFIEYTTSLCQASGMNKLKIAE